MVGESVSVPVANTHACSSCLLARRSKAVQVNSPAVSVHARDVTHAGTHHTTKVFSIAREKRTSFDSYKASLSRLVTVAWESSNLALYHQVERQDNRTKNMRELPCGSCRCPFQCIPFPARLSTRYSVKHFWIAVSSTY